MQTIKFKSPTTSQITIAGRTYKEGDITLDLYKRFINLSPALENVFVVNINPEENVEVNEEKRSGRVSGRRNTPVQPEG